MVEITTRAFAPVLRLVLWLTGTEWDAEHHHWRQRVREGVYEVIPDSVILVWMMLVILAVGCLLTAGIALVLRAG